MFDFYSAYLNGIISDGKTIYIEQLPYHEIADCSCYVVKLCKLLYELKQAGRKWYDTLCGFLTAIYFQKSMADPAVFVICVESNVVILFIHVDDTTMTGSFMDLIRKYE
jgi:Reverse transcriptase (RNA-dependent DNA polymerase)